MSDLIHKVSAAIMEARSSFFAETARREGYTYCDWLAKAAIDTIHQAQDEAKAASVEVEEEEVTYPPPTPLALELMQKLRENQAHQDPRERIAELEEALREIADWADQGLNSGEIVMVRRLEEISDSARALTKSQQEA
jgi:hypothetical protein